MARIQIKLIIFLVCSFHGVRNQLTANLTVLLVNDNINRKIEFNTTSLHSLYDALCDSSTYLYTFSYQDATGLLFDVTREAYHGNSSPYADQNWFGFNSQSGHGSFQMLSQNEICSVNKASIGLQKNNNVTKCRNKCIYVMWQSTILSGNMEYSKTIPESNDNSKCPIVQSVISQTCNKAQPNSQATTSKDTPTLPTILSANVSTTVIVTNTDGVTRNTSTELTSKGEPWTKTIIIAVTVSVGAILIITIVIIIVCVVLRNRNKSKQQEGREKEVQEKNNTIALDDTYTSTSDYNRIDEKQKGTTIIPVNNKQKPVNQYQNSLSPVKSEDRLSSSDTRNVNGNHVGDIYAVVNKPNTASHKTNSKSKVENTPTSNNVPEGGDDYSYVDKPGSHNSPSREGQATEYSTLHQVNRMPDDTYTLLGEQLARQNHVTNVGDRDESGSRDRPSDIQIVYLSAKGTGHNDEMKRTSVDI